MDFFEFLDLGFIHFKAIKVTTKSYQVHYWTPKMGPDIIISSFYAQRAKKILGQSPLQELEVGPHSRPYHLVPFMAPLAVKPNFLYNMNEIKKIDKKFK